MSTEREGFLGEIADRTDDMFPRLVYADWLEDNATCEADAARAEFIRLQIKLSETPECTCAAVNSAASYMKDYACDHCAMTRRESALFRKYAPVWFDPLPSPYRCTVSSCGIECADATHYRVRRGFVERVNSYLSFWLEHGPELVKSHPIEHVEIRDKGPLTVAHDSHGWCRPGHPHLDTAHSCVIPDDMWQLMFKLRWPPLDFHPTYWYVTVPTREEAAALLSRACIGWAHKVNRIASLVDSSPLARDRKART